MPILFKKTGNINFSKFLSKRFLLHSLLPIHSRSYIPYPRHKQTPFSTVLTISSNPIESCDAKNTLHAHIQFRKPLSHISIQRKIYTSLLWFFQHVLNADMWPWLKAPSFLIESVQIYTTLAFDVNKLDFFDLRNMEPNNLNSFMFYKWDPTSYLAPIRIWTPLKNLISTPSF